MFGPEKRSKDEDFEKRIAELEMKMDFLFKNLGIKKDLAAEDVRIPPEVKEILITGNKKAAIKKFMELYGASLKDAKIQVEKWKNELT